MPLLALNMATPINSSSQIFVLLDLEILKILKCIELIFALFTLTFFTMGVIPTESTAKGLLINACLGAITIFPLMCMAFPLNFYKAPRKMLACNVMVGLVHFVLSTLILSSWWKVQFFFDKINDKTSALYIRDQYSARMRFIGALLGVTNGIIYTSESVVMALEMKGYV